MQKIICVFWFFLQVNHRQILDGMFEACGVPDDKFRTACSAVDKLDKTFWEDVRAEMVDEKGIDPAAADRIGFFVQQNGGPELVDKLLTESSLKDNKAAKQGLEAMRLLLQYCEILGVLDKVYVPCVGVSIGIERVFSIMEAKAQLSSNVVRTIETQVLVASAQPNMLEERMKLCNQLWSAGIKAEMSYKKNPKMLDQYQQAEKYSIPLLAVIGEQELKDGVITLRNSATREENQIQRSDLIQVIKEKCDTENW
eukprot:XP_011676251.1 PREDICTED: histidine--tRNA ligase, cytoplasmic [Strongylocentrotus purpuratus]